tara:strand:- start:148 stop:327 length:180 start_codon:yes stop_codon:yes gene_type:complete
MKTIEELKQEAYDAEIAYAEACETADAAREAVADAEEGAKAANAAAWDAYFKALKESKK